MKTWSVDPKSYELAEHFADGENFSEAELKEFSQVIQDACEDYLSARRDGLQKNVDEVIAK